jgi:UDP-3-O-[3-hydroxymyristoyl] glucosamine N-acyltransferase
MTSQLSVRIRDVINIFGGTLQGYDIEFIQSLCSFSELKPYGFGFIKSNKKQILRYDIPCTLVVRDMPDNIPHDSKIQWLIVPTPELYFWDVAQRFFIVRQENVGSCHASVVKHESVVVGDDVAIGAHVTIGSGCSIGNRVTIHPGVHLAENISIGDDVCLYPRVCIYSNVSIGSRSIIHSGSVIGSDGFGYVTMPSGAYRKIPQIGGVFIGEDVEIGANTTIDAGTLIATKIGYGVKIDNLVHIAHNVEIGDYTAMAACVGIAGSTKIGKHCTIGGAAMFVGHIAICDHVHIGGGTLVSKSITEPGVYSSSFPFLSRSDWQKNAVHIRQLDHWTKRIRNLEKARS